MQYIECLFKIILLQFIIIIFHELLHLFIAKLFKLKLQSIFFIPFKFSKRKSFDWDFNITLNKNLGCTSSSSYYSKKLSTSTDYLMLLKKLSIYLWVGPLYDFSIFVILFVIGVASANNSYLLLLSLLHFGVSTINFFNSDGKFVIGAKEDTRIAYNLVSNFTVFCNNKASESTKRIMTDKHMSIARDINLSHFDVNDLWNFLNTLNFFTDSLLSYLNKDLYSLHPNTEKFFNLLIEDFDTIKELDYRQAPKVSNFIILYLIYKKSIDINYECPHLLHIKLVNNVQEKVYFYLLNYYYDDIDPTLTITKKELELEIKNNNENIIKFI